MQFVSSVRTCAFLFLCAAAAFGLPGLGVNIHTTAPEPGETALIRSAGFRTVRMDLHWHDTETALGAYDFAAYDRLIRALEAEGIRPLLILNYGHPRYDAGKAPASPEARAAFARWAAAAAARYRGRGILWEIYNEPNLGHFWKPAPDAAAYVELVEATAAAIRAAAPGETIIGPALSGIDLEFLENCFRLGLLRRLDAVTVHPYRLHEPESAIADYRRVRALIARYAPPGREIPLLCGEWGYSALWTGQNERVQALMLSRMFLTNAAARIPLTIWYDWRNSGPALSDPENNYGLLTRQGEPKLAFRSAQCLARELDGYNFHLRLETGRPDEFVLLFRSGPSLKLAAWTTSGRPRPVTLPTSAGVFRAVDWLGSELPAMRAAGEGLSLILTQEPVLFEPVGANSNLSLAADWDALPQSLTVEAPAEIVLSTNRVKRPISVLRNQGRSESFLDLPLGDGKRWRQSVWVEVANPLELTITPNLMEVSKPFGEALSAELQTGEFRTPVELPAGEAEQRFSLPEAASAAGVVLVNRAGQLLAMAPAIRFLPSGPLISSRVVYDGDPSVAVTAGVTPTCPEGAGERDCATIQVESGSGPGFVRLTPHSAGNAFIPQGAVALGAWVFGDASGMILRLRFTDAAGQTFQPAGAAVNWRGWRWVELPIQGDEARLASWGGAADGQPRGPLTLDTTLLIDKPGPQAFKGQISVSPISWVCR